MLKTVLLTLLLSMHASVTQAGDFTCDEVRMDVPGGSMEEVIRKMPRLTQTSGTCSFHAAVQMYDSWRIMHQDYYTNLSSSPITLAFEQKLINNGKDFDGGAIGENLSLLLKRGSCERRFFNPSTGRDEDEVTYERIRRAFMRNTSEIFTDFNPTQPKSKKSFQDIKEKLMLDVADALGFRDFYSFKPSNEQVDRQVAIAMMTKNFTLFVQAIIPPTCHETERLKTNTPFFVMKESFGRSLGRYHWAEPNLVKKRLHHELNKGAASPPIGIGYCSSVLAKGPSFQHLETEDDACKAHASLVIGRRVNQKTGSCQFLIRNTWGSEHSYHRAWKAESGKSLVWVDADVLAKAVFSVTSIEPKETARKQIKN